MIKLYRNDDFLIASTCDVDQKFYSAGGCVVATATPVPYASSPAVLAQELAAKKQNGVVFGYENNTPVVIRVQKGRVLRSLDSVLKEGEPSVDDNQFAFVCGGKSGVLLHDVKDVVCDNEWFEYFMRVVREVPFSPRAVEEVAERYLNDCELRDLRALRKDVEGFSDFLKTGGGSEPDTLLFKDLAGSFCTVLNTSVSAVKVMKQRLDLSRGLSEYIVNALPGVSRAYRTKECDVLINSFSKYVTLGDKFEDIEACTIGTLAMNRNCFYDCGDLVGLVNWFGRKTISSLWKRWCDLPVLSVRSVLEIGGVVALTVRHGSEQRLPVGKVFELLQFDADTWGDYSARAVRMVKDGV
jgi:hypothetical protein